MSCELRDDEVETPLVQLVAPNLSPLCRKVAPRFVEGRSSSAAALMTCATDRASVGNAKIARQQVSKPRGELHEERPVEPRSFPQGLK